MTTDAAGPLYRSGWRVCDHSGVSRKCSACAAKADPREVCPSCGEAAEARGAVWYCSVSILDKCGACGQPLPVDGPLLEHFCSHCQSVRKFQPGYWSLLDDVLKDSKHSGGTLDGFSLNFQTDVRHRLAAPSCGECERPIPVAAIETGADGEHNCPSCGTAFDTYPAPDWLRKVMSKAAQIFFAPRAGSAGGVELPDDVKPVLFPCPACAGSLKITAHHDRIVTCEYCASDCYLPDALWNRLHPPRVRSTWYVRFHDPGRAARLAADARRREATQADKIAGYQRLLAEIDARRGSDPDAASLSTFFSVTTAEERAAARSALERAIASGWSLEPTARCVMELRELFKDSSREDKLRRKLEVLIAERNGPAALSLLDGIKVSED
jgi:hypothetical protein